MIRVTELTLFVCLVCRPELLVRKDRRESLLLLSL